MRLVAGVMYCITWRLKAFGNLLTPVDRGCNLLTFPLAVLQSIPAASTQ